MQGGGRNHAKGWFVVVEPADAELLGDASLRRSDEYLQGESDCLQEGWAVINLCRSYDYLTVGYYVSLVADARGHRVLPGVELVEDLSSPFTYFRALQEAGIDTIDYKVIPGRRLVLPKLIVAPDDSKERAQGKPLTEEEVGAYISHRLAIASAARSVVFSPNALKVVHDYSGGIPRVINMLCDRALLGGYTAQTTRIDEDLVVTAAEGLDLKPPVRSQRSFFSRLLRRA